MIMEFLVRIVVVLENPEIQIMTTVLSELVVIVYILVVTLS